MGKNRDRLSIIAAILDAASSGASKTKIMSEANLSFSLLEKYLSVVAKSGFIRLDDQKYQLTERGHEFLRAYNQLYDRYFQTNRVLETLDYERERLSKLCYGFQFQESIKSERLRDSF
ncbi:MAG: winged helix-turn-helix domain-containing protein [Candidatus Bathyarchaeota archaeon]|nr:winged helix-turn-helix domain-containing protein [Candidatus Bathyarchaeota archaeon]